MSSQTRTSRPEERPDLIPGEEINTNPTDAHRQPEDVAADAHAVESLRTYRWRQVDGRVSDEALEVVTSLASTFPGSTLFTFDDVVIDDVNDTEVVLTVSLLDEEVSS